MKKIISLVFVIAMLFACTAPAYADSFSGSWNKIERDVIYNELDILYHTLLIIDCNVEIKKGGYIRLEDETSLHIQSNGTLIGEDLSFFMVGKGNRIRLYDGVISLSFCDSIYADEFEQFLKDNRIDYICDGNRIIAGCSHSEWEDDVCIRCGFHCPHETYENGACTVCGKACENEVHNGKYTCPDCGMVVDAAATGSILSQGYPEIVFGIGGLAVGFIAAMLIFRKKKVAVSSTLAEDEE